MDKKSAETLWLSISSYGDANSAFSGEGNSGEFSSAKESERLSRELVKVENELIETFSRLTGYSPIRCGNGWVLVENP